MIGHSVTPRMPNQAFRGRQLSPVDKNNLINNKSVACDKPKITDVKVTHLFLTWIVTGEESGRPS